MADTELIDRVVRTVRLTGKTDREPASRSTITVKMVTHMNNRLGDVEAALDDAVSEERLETDGETFWIPENAAA